MTFVLIDCTWHLLSRYSSSSLQKTYCSYNTGSIQSGAASKCWRQWYMTLLQGEEKVTVTDIWNNISRQRMMSEIKKIDNCCIVHGDQLRVHGREILVSRYGNMEIRWGSRDNVPWLWRFWTRTAMLVDSQESPPRLLPRAIRPWSQRAAVTS